MENENYHEPVLVHEVLTSFAPLKNARIIDATLGTGGHTLALIKEGAEVLGIEKLALLPNKTVGGPLGLSTPTSKI